MMVAFTCLPVLLVTTAVLLWMRATFGPWSDAWNLGNGLMVTFVCVPMLHLALLLSLVGCVLSLRILCRGRRWFGGILLLIHLPLLLATSAVNVWRAKAASVATRPPSSWSRTESTWFTPWGWQPASRLEFAVFSCDAEEVRRLVRAGADVNARPRQRQWRINPGYTPLQTAVGLGDPVMTGLLVRLGADPMAGDGEAPFWRAMQENDTSILAAMHEAGMELPQEALFFACDQRRLSLVEWLLAHGADVRAGLGDRGTSEIERHGSPLHMAVAAGDVAIVDHLIQHGADLNQAATGAVGPPLMVAVEHANLGMVEHLLSKGADPTWRRRDGWTILHNAAMKGRVDLVDCLIQRAPSLIHAKTDSDSTPLSVACFSSRGSSTDVVRFLIQHGADRGVTNRQGEDLLTQLRKDRDIFLRRGDEKRVKDIDEVMALIQPLR